MFNSAFLPWQIFIAHLNIYNLNIFYFSNQAYYVLIVSFHDKSNFNIFQQTSLILPFIVNFVCVFTTSMVKGMLEPYFRNITNPIQSDKSENNTNNQLSHFIYDDETFQSGFIVNTTLLNDTLFSYLLLNNSSQTATVQTSFSQNDIAVLFCIQGVIYMITNLFIGIVSLTHFKLRF